MPYKDPEKRRRKQREYQKRHYERKRWYYLERSKEQAKRRAELRGVSTKDSI